VETAVVDVQRTVGTTYEIPGSGARTVEILVRHEPSTVRPDERSPGPTPPSVDRPAGRCANPPVNPRQAETACAAVACGQRLFFQSLVVGQVVERR
jgi:hypothetical protein